MIPPFYCACASSSPSPLTLQHRRVDQHGSECLGVHWLVQEPVSASAVVRLRRGRIAADEKRGNFKGASQPFDGISAPSAFRTAIVAYDQIGSAADLEQLGYRFVAGLRLPLPGQPQERNRPSVASSTRGSSSITTTSLLARGAFMWRSGDFARSLFHFALKIKRVGSRGRHVLSSRIECASPKT